MLANMWIIQRIFLRVLFVFIFQLRWTHDTDAEDEQFLLNMIGEGQGDVPEQADDGSNTDIYLNMSGDGIEAPSIQDDAAAEQNDTAGEQSANVHITTIFTCIEHHIFI